MVKLMNVNQLVKIAADAGIKLEPATPDTENLYVYAVDEENPEDQHTVYVGKSTDRSRSLTESRVQARAYIDTIGLGFSALVVENNATRHSFHFDPSAFDPTAILGQIESREWAGRSIDALKLRLDAHTPETPALSRDEVEALLIRVHVNTGRLTGNSEFASQWEASNDRIPNLAAVLAVDIARHNGTLPLGTEVAAGPDVEAHDDAE
ncbi:MULTISPECIES: hypothetical protein [unclassified Microbacterium]|uniref:hypothetical protein n=1 Tax=unclassified Microbacterium TaxID=2609290 RepID=UPI0034677737